MISDNLFKDKSPPLGAFVLVDVETQSLYHLQNREVIKIYPVSTAANGVGEKKGSFQTPRGWHQVRAKIGQNQPTGAVFVGRRPTGEICSPAIFANNPDRDWILSRILWLSGLEVGKNRLNDCDTMQRYIYIHGSPDEKLIITPGSKGCIRMHNKDIIELFDYIPAGTKVFIRG